VVVLGPDGSPAFTSPGAPTLAPTRGSGPATVRAPDGSADAIYSLPAPAGATVIAGSPVADIDRSLAGLAATMAILAVAEVVLSVLGGWWLAGRALAPVARLAREADAIGSSELDRRLAALEGDDELGTLARTLNRMLARVDESARRQRAFVIGASHDLRTPLAALRTELELALLHPSDGPALHAAVAAAHADAVRLSELANGLLRMAAAEPGGRRLEPDDAHLPRLLQECVHLVAASAAARSVAIEVAAPDLVVRVDRSRLVQAVANLLANAVRFAPEGSAVEVAAALDAGSHPPILQVDVLDRGPGVPQDFRSTLFEPFARARPAGSAGSGLGLATAAAAVHAHGGTIDYVDRPDGGAHFWFRVPA
jgi:signal transduction histidine kinase